MKIAEGKYSGSEFSSVIQPYQEYSLRTLALETLVVILLSMTRFNEELERKQGEADLIKEEAKDLPIEGSSEKTKTTIDTDSEDDNMHMEA